MPLTLLQRRLRAGNEWSQRSHGLGCTTRLARPAADTASCAIATPSLRRALRPLKPPFQLRQLSLRQQGRSYASPFNGAEAPSGSGVHAEMDDWSTIEVEVLEPAAAATMMYASHPPATAGGAKKDSDDIDLGGVQGLPVTADAAEIIDVVDTYAKAKVMNFIRRQQPHPQPQKTPHEGSASSAGARSTTGYGGGSGGPSSSAALQPPSSSSSSSSGSAVPGLEVRQVQGADGSDGTIQFHARWHLPLPTEYGARFGEGFAPTAKEAENVAAMHAERVIDALGFPLFLLSSKQRKHAEAARAAGRWAPLPLPATADNTAPSATAEVLPPPNTPSPPPLQLVRVSARQQQERKLHIDNVQFTPVEKGVFAALTCTLASPFYFDSSSVRRIDAFFKVHRTSFRRCLRFFVLQNGQGGGTASHHRQSGAPGQRELVLAQLTLPLPPRFGIRVAMGRGPTKKDAVTLACMHAELIIDAVGLALYPANHKLQALHAEECARVRRWCAPPGDCDYRYSTVSPAPMELVEKLNASAAAAAAGAVAPSPSSQGGAASADADEWHNRGQYPHTAGEPQEGRSGAADIEVGRSSSGSVESILLQHHRAVCDASRFTNEVSMKEYENARLLLERYLEQFMVAASPSSGTGSPLLSLMFVEALGQRNQTTYRATITVPLVDEHGLTKGSGERHSTDPATGWTLQPSSLPLPYTQSFVALGVSDTSPIAELAASLHALRTLATLNRLTLLQGSPAVSQAMESFAVRAKLPLYCASRPMLNLSELPSEELPAAVRVMEGVIGRVTAAGLAKKAAEARAQVFMPGATVPSRREKSFTAASATPFGVTQRQSRQDFLLQELQQARGHMPRLDWDTHPDAQNRIVVAPDASPQSAREYFHTLSTVRNPDGNALLRIRDYLERHGKTLDMMLTTTRARVSESAPEEGFMFVATLVLPIPEVSRRRAEGREEMMKSKDHAEGNKEVTRLSMSSNPLMSPSSSSVDTAACVAQGEASTREDAALMCAAHAELLLDALGVPMYDHSGLQCKHADAARALGRWAPLVRGGLMAPAALRPLPPPIRKAAAKSALWARVQRERQTDAATAAATLAQATVPASSGDAATANVNDDAICDIARMCYVHPTEVFIQALRFTNTFFASRGLDFFRSVRQYKIKDARYGIVHRAIVEVPIAAEYGKRYAVGAADSKRLALLLCAQHVARTLDCLNIQLRQNKKAQVTYARYGAIKGSWAPMPSDGLATPDTPTPPGFYSLELSAAASERPPVVPMCPTAEAAMNEFVWKTYVRKCETYLQRWITYTTKRALSTVSPPTLPRTHVAAEDAALDVVEPLPTMQAAERTLKDLCGSAGLPNPLQNRALSETVKLSTERRVYMATFPLVGTPYTSRGCSDVNGWESRQRAYMHGIHLVRTVVRANGDSAPTRRRGWAEGVDRRVCVAAAQRGGGITHHGRVWVLRVWCAMHCPARILQLEMRLEDEEASKGGCATPPHESAAASRTGQAMRTGETPVPELSATTTADAVAPSSHSYPQPSFAVPDASHPSPQRETLSQQRSVSYYAAVSVENLGKAAASGEAIREVCVVPGEGSASVAVQGAVQKLFSRLQRTPTMQALCGFLSHQPQLHLPSLRTLRDANSESSGVVHQFAKLLLSCVGTASNPDSSAAKIRRANHPKLRREVSMLSLTLASDAFGALPAFDTWPVEVLQRWVRAQGSTVNTTAVAAEEEKGIRDNLDIPSTLVPLFAAYGGFIKTAGAPVGHGVRDQGPRDVCAAPSRVADALAVLCRCLPPPLFSPTSSPSILAPRVSSAAALHDNSASLSTVATIRGRTLPLQLAHVLLMGLLLDCMPWAVRLVAMVVYAGDTLQWCREAMKLNNTAWPPLSIDVVDAVLRSADGTAPPLPEVVDVYAREVTERLHHLSATLSSHAEGEEEATMSSEDVANGAWLGAAARSLVQHEDGKRNASSSPPPLLSGQETRALRSLLQCAVAASTAAQGVWVRAGGVEQVVREYQKAQLEEEDGQLVDEQRVVGTDAAKEVLPALDETFVFHSRTAAHVAAVCVSGGDLTRTDGDSLHTLSSMATCFSVFDCAVPPSVEDHSTAYLPHIPCSSPSGDDSDNSEVVAKTEDDEKEAEGAGVEMEAAPLPGAQFTSVMGTCVSPLAAMVVGQAPYCSHSTPLSVVGDDVVDVSALQLAEEDLPMLMVAFGDTVPLLVHDNKSAVGLQQLAVHFRSRVLHLTPFTEDERKALGRLVALPVDAIGEDDIDDLYDGPHVV